jgi:hypothetical protein
MCPVAGKLNISGCASVSNDSVRYHCFQCYTHDNDNDNDELMRVRVCTASSSMHLAPEMKQNVFIIHNTHKRALLFMSDWHSTLSVEILTIHCY